MGPIGSDFALARRRAAYARHRPPPVDPALARRAIYFAARACAVPAVAMLTPRRGRVALARHLAAWLLHRVGLTYTEIGRLFGQRHSTAHYGCRVVSVRMRTHPGFAATVRTALASAVRAGGPR